jgi:hypothetical protein
MKSAFFVISFSHHLIKFYYSVSTLLSRGGFYGCRF